MNAVIRAYDAVVDDVNTEKRSVVARINTSNVDRYNTVILARGGTIGRWLKAGAPVLWEHGKDPRNFTDPIANSPRMWNNGGPNPTELIAEPVFRDNEFSQQRFEMYRDGKVKGWSVNILPNPRSASPPTTEELRSRPDWEGAELIYRQWDLAEFSGTVIPGNADALTADRAAAVMELVQRGSLWLPDEARTIYQAAMSRPQPADAVERYITHKDGKCIVHAEDGKVLGTHDSKADIEKQLTAVEAHKHDEGRSGPYIDTDGQTWTVRDAEGTALAMYADPGLADESLRLMGAAKPSDLDGYARTLLQLISERRSRDAEREEEIIARLELKFLGRV